MNIKEFMEGDKELDDVLNANEVRSNDRLWTGTPFMSDGKEYRLGIFRGEYQGEFHPILAIEQGFDDGQFSVTLGQWFIGDVFGNPSMLIDAGANWSVGIPDKAWEEVPNKYSNFSPTD